MKVLLAIVLLIALVVAWTQVLANYQDAKAERDYARAAMIDASSRHNAAMAAAMFPYFAMAAMVIGGALAFGLIFMGFFTLLAYFKSQKPTVVYMLPAPDTPRLAMYREIEQAHAQVMVYNECGRAYR